MAGRGQLLEYYFINNELFCFSSVLVSLSSPLNPLFISLSLLLIELCVMIGGEKNMDIRVKKNLYPNTYHLPSIALCKRTEKKI